MALRRLQRRRRSRRTVSSERGCDQTLRRRVGVRRRRNAGCGIAKVLNVGLRRALEAQRLSNEFTWTVAIQLRPELVELSDHVGDLEADATAGVEMRNRRSRNGLVGDIL